ncbi:hypothetical protein BGZ54_009058 [Gamsiella multidivaricata]|nr:hypothetical protein BGZ54_009058 [Gamsiella multidivaricata]
MTEVPTYNILLLGQTQAGKSTFLQAVRSYANPNCELDSESIGNGNSSHTTEVQIQTVETNFSEYRLFDMSTPHRSNPMQFMQDDPAEREVTSADFQDCATVMQYKRKLDCVDGYELRWDQSSQIPLSKIRIFDTPGLNDTNGHDERNVSKILSALSSAGSIHLVLILIARQTPLTLELQATLRNYSNIFSAMGALISFVHTKVDFRSQYQSDRTFTAFIQERKTCLNRIMGRSVPHHFIDCDLEEYRPAYLYFRQQAIRRLLLSARMNRPVSLGNMQLYKTQRMIDVDALIAMDYKKKLAEVKNKMSFVSSAIGKIDYRIDETRYDIRELEEFLRNNDTEDLELIHVASFTQHWEWFELFGSRQEADLRAPDFDYAIDEVRVEMSGIEIKETRGGKGCKSWSVRLLRHLYNHGTYHARLYAKRSKARAEAIGDHKAKLTRTTKTLKDLIHERDSLDKADSGEDGTPGMRQQLATEHNQCLDMTARASRTTLHLNLFKAIAEAGVYEGRPVDCVQMAVDFYSTYKPAEGEEAALRPGRSH